MTGASPSAATSPYVIARAAAQAARAVPGVLDLDGGAVGEFATYGQGTKVAGVRAHAGTAPGVSLRLVVGYGWPLHEIADDVRDRVVGALGRFPDLASGGARPTVDIAIVDVWDGPPATAQGAVTHELPPAGGGPLVVAPTSAPVRTVASPTPSTTAGTAPASPPVGGGGTA